MSWEDSERARHLSALGVSEFQMGKMPQALEYFQQALLYAPEDMLILSRRAEAMRHIRGREELALKEFVALLRRDPKNLFNLHGQVGALVSLGRGDEARAVLREIIKLAPNNARAAKLLAQLTSEGEGVTAGSGGPNDAIESVLDTLGRDLSALSRQGSLVVAGRTNEILSTAKVLLRRQKANPLLIGEPGVGKTAIVEGLANLLASDAAPERLKGSRIVEIAISDLVADTKFRGTFEKRIQKLVKECSDPKVILFIDEIHMLVGSGRTEGSASDGGNALKPALARGQIRCIGATTLAEYEKYICSDGALERRFHPIHVTEPAVPQAIEILAQSHVRAAYAKHHGIEVPVAAAKECVRLAADQWPHRRLPDKAFDLLDDACVEAALAGEKQLKVSRVRSTLKELLGSEEGDPHPIAVVAGAEVDHGPTAASIRE